MSLNDWLKSGWLAEHKTSPAEIANLMAIADRDLQDCRAKGLSADWKLNIAYNAALQVATAALAAAGYRASRESHHYRVLQSLAFTLGAEPALIAQLDQFRKKRNVGGYEQAGRASDLEAGEMAALAAQLRDRTTGWLRKAHPNLLPRQRP